MEKKQITQAMENIDKALARFREHILGLFHAHIKKENDIDSLSAFESALLITYDQAQKQHHYEFRTYPVIPQGQPESESSTLSPEMRRYMAFMQNQSFTYGQDGPWSSLPWFPISQKKLPQEDGYSLILGATIERKNNAINLDVLLFQQQDDGKFYVSDGGQLLEPPKENLPQIWQPIRYPRIDEIQAALKSSPTTH